MRGPAAAIARVATTTLVLLALFSEVALAQGAIGLRRIGVHFREGAPKVSVSIADLANANTRRALESGLRKTIAVTVEAYAERGDRLLARREETCTVMYDLWEDRYVVRTERGSSAHRSVDSVIDACLVLRALRVGEASDYEKLQGQHIYFVFRAEFNPITRSRCRRLLGNAGSDDPIGPVVANIVRREICRAERSIDFRSQVVTVPR